ncbi:MAG: extracellular solute-binding protein, partial [Oscillospiraceae bacterium]|nr:extracellular solute-binding protein [Oscillospiraceae bacterium]
MNNIIKKTAVFLLCIALGMGAVVCRADDEINETTQPSQGNQTTSQYADFLQENSNLSRPQQEIIVNAKDYTSASENAAVLLDSLDGVDNPVQTNDDGYVEWTFNAPQAGLYQIEICYYPTEGKGNEIERTISINSTIPYTDLESIKLKRTYSNQSKEFVKDKNGNYLRPVQVENPMFINQVLTGSGFQAKKSLFVKLENGLNTIRLTAIKEPMAISYIRFFNTESTASYSETKKSYPASEEQVEPILIEGENATLKSDAVLYPVDDRTSPMNSPSSVSNVVINAIGGSYWAKPKMWIQWDFEVPKTGVYRMYIRGKQDQNAGIISYRKLTIDGELPFSEADELSFNYKNGWQMFEIGDEANGAYTFYLEKGNHTLRLENNVGELSDILENLNDVVVGLNSCYRQIFMLTGSYPDSDRDYSIESSLPDLKAKFKKLAKELKNVKEEFFALTNTKGTAYSTMDKMQVQLDSFVKDMETIPARLDVYRTNIGNVSDLLLSATEQPLLIDWIQFAPENQQAPKADANVFSKFIHGAKSFFVSFVIDYNNISSSDSNDNSIDLWLGSTASAVGTGRDQAQALQALIENTFSNKTNINVNIRLVDVSVLLPAVSTNRGPDVAIGLASNLPMNYAYRNAVYNLSNFSDFDEVATRFNSEALTQFRYRDSVYALPDKYSFYMMFYRKDILEELGLSVPQTWNDVY